MDVTIRCSRPASGGGGSADRRPMLRAAGKNWPNLTVPSEIGQADQGLHE